MEELLTSSTPWIEAGVTLLLGVAVAAAVAALLNVAVRRLLRDPRTAGRISGSTFWALTVLAAVVAVGRLAEPEATRSGLEAAAARLLTAIPDLLVGLVVLVLGWSLAVALRTVLDRMLGRIAPTTAGVVAAVAFWSVLVLTVLVAADQIGIQVGVLRQLLLLLVAGAVAAVALALGLGSRDAVAAVVAGRHTERIVGVGDDVEVAGHRGRVTAVGHASVTLRTAAGAIVEVPHTALLAQPVVVHARADAIPAAGPGGGGAEPPG
ncbi:MAG: mechanosensitive ion channel domain-containing protein [Actinomycetes bacterium]